MPTEVKGAVELRIALKHYAPDLSLQMQKEIASFLKPLVAKARGFLPADDEMLSGWTKPITSEGIKYRPFPKYSQAVAKRGITFSTAPSKANRQGFRYLARVINKSAPGAIVETAGRKNPQGAPQDPNGGYNTSTGEYVKIETYHSTNSRYNKSLNPNAGKQFINRLNSAVGPVINADIRTGPGRRSRKKSGRLIFRAWKEDQGRANAAIIKAIEKSNQHLVDRVNKSNTMKAA